ncbi:hypothetical protein BP5796_02154 [Coleophoma crateriformis]|uniref:Major facilitator superfamily (MFS) profile domain-containing protein n=1 Tax=Coleophoma crateriformis TaxID=565419 RepID=A0A3D8SXJ9_9HELO|nr:hypothetical protein BP5796_02154 [Coleophoma crateriformis]
MAKTGAEGQNMAISDSAAPGKDAWQDALKSHPRALLWCSYALLTCVMWGYDGLAGSIVLAIAQFRKDYGQEFEGKFVIPAIWQLAFGAGGLIGLVGGGAVTGVAAKKWGRQICIMVAYVFSVVGVFLQWFSPGNLPLFFGGKVLTGLPLGVFVTIAPTYCAEIAPAALRGAVTAGVNWSIVLGQCLAYVVMRQTQSLPGPNAYRILFGVQWIFAAISLAILPFFVESPYHLVAQGKDDKARVNIRKLYGDDTNAEGMLVSIKADLDNANQTLRAASFRDCFRGTNTQRTLIAMSTFVVQAVCGISWIIGYMAYFLILGGMSDARAFDATVGLSFIMLVGNMFGWVLIEKFGRRGTALWGVMSILPVAGALWAQVAFMAVWSFTYQATIGSVAWPIITEVSTSALRGHTQSLATITNGLAGAVSGVLLPFAVNPDQGNMGGRIAFIYGGFLSFCCILIWMYYPETKGRSFAEIDRLFEMGIRPRDFRRTVLLPAKEAKGAA